MYSKHLFDFLPSDDKAAITHTSSHTTPFSHTSTVHMLTLVLYDPCIKIRGMAASTLAVMLDDCPLARWAGPLDGVAVGGRTAPRRPSAFGTQSERYGKILRALHTGMLHAIRHEQHHTVTAQILKCITVLVSNTPYQHLQATSRALLVPIVVHLITHLLHQPSSYATTPTPTPTPSSTSLTPPKHDLRHAVFTCLAAICDTHQPVPELSAYLQGNAG